MFQSLLSHICAQTNITLNYTECVKIHFYLESQVCPMWPRQLLTASQLFLYCRPSACKLECEALPYKYMAAIFCIHVCSDDKIQCAVQYTINCKDVAIRFGVVRFVSACASTLQLGGSGGMLPWRSLDFILGAMRLLLRPLLGPYDAPWRLDDKSFTCMNVYPFCPLRRRTVLVSAFHSSRNPHPLQMRLVRL